MKRTLITLLSLIFIVGMVSACTSGNTPSPSSNEGKTPSNNEQSNGGNDKQASKKDPIKLTFWGGVPAESGPQDVVDAWNAEHPDVQVEYVRYVNDDDGNLKLDTALMTDQGVDLYVNYGLNRLENRVNSGAALDLGEFGDYNIDEKMGPGAKAWLFEDKYYAMPTKKDIFFVWLNKDALDEANLPVPTEWTLDEMAAYAETLKQENRYGLVKHTEPYPDLMDGSLVSHNYVKADGTSDFDNPIVGTWLETLKNMMDSGATPPLGEQLTSQMPVDTIFLKGEAAMLDAGEWIFRSSNNMEDNPRDFTIAFAPIPSVTADQAEYKVRGGIGDGISVNAKSKHIEEAWEFLKWYADGGMAPMAAGGRLPASKDANVDEAIQALLGDHADTYDEASLKHAVFGQFDTYNRNLPQQVMDLRQQEYEKYFLGNQDLASTLEAMAKRHNEYIKQNQ